MSDLQELVRDTASRLFRDHCTKDVQDAAERGTWPAAAWDAAWEAGRLSALDPEATDGPLLPLSVLAPILEMTGVHAVPLPVGETLLAQRLFTAAGLAFPDGPLSIASGLDPLPDLSRTNNGWELSGPVRRVPWGRYAQAIAVAARYGERIVLVRLEGLRPDTLGVNLAGEARDSFELTGHRLSDDAVQDNAAEVGSRLRFEGALLRALQIAGALGRVLEQTVQYSLDRVQFGRPIATFQAVQHQVAVLAGQSAAAVAAAAAAVTAAWAQTGGFEIAAAKLRTSEAAGIGCEIAHQVHGAIGVTHEYDLHLRTRRLLSWRDEFGSETEWAYWIGERVRVVGGDGLWSYIQSPYEVVREQVA